MDVPLPHVITALFFLPVILTTHFRGAHIWVKPASTTQSPRLMDVNYRIAWRLDYSEKTHCNQTKVQTQELMGPETAGYIMCYKGCSDVHVRIGDVQIVCTDFSIAEDWMTGVNHHAFDFPKFGQYILRWGGRGWLSGVNHGHDVEWELRAMISLLPRRDNAELNTSPTSAITPVIRIIHGCEHVIYVPVQDDDGDVVKCRWANSNFGECGGVCNSFPDAVLDEDACSLTYQAHQETGFFAVAIQLEDYLPGSTTLLSSVPLQFLIEVYGTSDGSPGECKSKPIFVVPTPTDGTCIPVYDQDTFQTKLVARTTNTYVQIAEILTVSPSGFIKSDLAQYGGDPRDYYVDITWTPTAAHQGEHLLCFSAVDGSGVASEQNCITLVVGHPSVIEITRNRDQRKLTLDFNQEIKRPTKTQFITLYTEAGREVQHYNTYDPSEVSFSNRSLTFTVPTDTEWSGCYYIQMDEGAVLSRSIRCSVESQAVSDNKTLLFDIGGDVLTPGTPSAVSQPKEFNYLWLIVIIVGLAVLAAVIIILAVFINRAKKQHDEDELYTRKQQQEDYFSALQTRGFDNRGQDFNEFAVKYR